MLYLNQKIIFNQLPSAITTYYRDIDGLTLKVGLYFLIHEEVDEEQALLDLSIPESVFNRAVLFWKEKQFVVEKDIELVNENIQPSRLDHDKMADMVMLDPEIATLLQESQQILGKELSLSESRILLEIYENYLPSVYAVLNIESYWMLRKERKKVLTETLYTAKEWNNLGIRTEAEYDKQIHLMEQCDEYISKIAEVTGIDRKDLTRKQCKVIQSWLLDFGYDESFVSEVMLRKNDANIAYINSVLKDWNKKGIKNISETRDRPMNIESNNSSGAFSPLFTSILNKNKDDPDQ